MYNEDFLHLFVETYENISITHRDGPSLAQILEKKCLACVCTEKIYNLPKIYNLGPLPPKKL